MSLKNQKINLKSAKNGALTAAAVFLALMVSLPVFSRQPIPGIDPIPRATDPGEYKQGSMEPKSEEPKKEEPQKSPENDQAQKEPPKDNQTKPPEQPQNTAVISNLKVEPDPFRPYTMKITWKESPANDTVIYIVRDARPISDTNRLFKATNITKPPVSPQKGEFTDEDIPEGTYYYAAVTAFEASREESIKMIPGGNYTVSPIIIDRSKDTPKPSENNAGPGPSQPAQNHVDSIIAQSVQEGVRISWRPVSGAENAVYRVYRSEYPLNSESGFTGAMRIGEIRGKETYIIDRSPVSREVYYGVTFAESLNSPEIRDLVYQKSFINHTYKTAETAQPQPAKDEEGKTRISGIIAVSSDKTVKISWVPAERTGIFYTVYRILRTGGNDTLESGERLGFVPETGSYFEDVSPLADKEVFYAVTVTDRKTNQEYKDLEFRQSFINHVFAKKSDSKTGQSLADRNSLPDSLMTYQQDSKTVQLLWMDPVAPVQKMGVYRLDRPISSADVLRYAQRLATVGRGENQYIDKDLGPGRYFYGLFPLENTGNPVPVFEEGRTFTGFAVTIREKEQKAELAENHPKPETPKEPEKPNLSSEKQQEELEALRKEREALEKERREFAEWRRKQEQESRKRTRPSWEQDTEDDYERRPRRKINDDAYIYEEEDSIYKEDPSEIQENRRILNELLAGTYLQGRYGEAVRKISIYLESEKPDQENKARARLYLGLSFYNLKRYSEALDYFSASDVQKYYPERSRFWIKRTTELRSQTLNRNY